MLRTPKMSSKQIIIQRHCCILLCTFLLGALTGCAKKETIQQAQHVIMISLDTTRPDHFGCYGNSWIQTPHIDQLASESIVFKDYMTVVPTTLPSHTSLFTGTYPHTHGTPLNGYTVNDKNVLLTELLKKAGFYTAGFISSFALDSRFNFAQGFDVYDQKYEQFKGTEKRTQHERSAKSVTNAVIRHLENKNETKRLFLFVHYFDPHKPFDPPAPFDTLYTWEQQSQKPDRIAVSYQVPRPATLNDVNWELSKNAAVKYAGEITFMDEQIGRLLAYLKKRGILEKSLLIITSDHGENFWEHMPYFHHGTATYQTTMQGVCIVRLPGKASAGTVVTKPIASIDILPSVLSYLGLPIPTRTDGRPFPLTNPTNAPPPRTYFGQATLTRPWKPKNNPVKRWQHENKARCIREGNDKYIQIPYFGIEELFDLAHDPYEQNNLLKKPAPEIELKARQLNKKLTAWVKTARPLASSFVKEKRRDTIEKLRALGYIE